MTVNNRNIVAVYIRGLAFKCASGSRREQVLKSLSETDERGQGNALLLMTVCLLGGWGLGILTSWWLL